MDLVGLFKNEKSAAVYGAGEQIFAEGDPADSMYVVLAGEVVLSVRSIEIDTIKAGDMFGEMALIDTKPRSATAMARTDCRLVALNEERFSFFVQQTPHFAIVVMRALVSRLREMDDTLG